MLTRQEIRRAIPWPLKRRLYDMHRLRRRRWRAAGGVQSLPDGELAALTFDDGPEGRETTAVLDALQQADAPATFFVLGQHALEQPDLIAEIGARGHEVALHGMSHRRHDRLGPEEAEEELSQGIAAVEQVSGVRPRWYRPPFGRSSPQLASICERLRLTQVYWTTWGHDWEPLPASHVVKTVLGELGPGGIVLLHDSALYAERDDIGATVAAIPAIVAGARDTGLRLTTLSGALDGAG